MTDPLLRDTRDQFARPRRFSEEDRDYLGIVAPEWMEEDDELAAIYREQARLLADGDVVWGWIVQANSKLYDDDGDLAHPGTMVYYERPTNDESLETLAEVARALGDLKGTRPDDPEERAYADMLTGEVERAMTLRPPRSIIGDLPIRSTGVMFHRKHLPVPYLANQFLPILTTRSPSGAAMVLPARFWAADLLDAWCSPEKRPQVETHQRDLREDPYEREDRYMLEGSRLLNNLMLLWCVAMAALAFTVPFQEPRLPVNVVALGIAAVFGALGVRRFKKLAWEVEINDAELIQKAALRSAVSIPWPEIEEVRRNPKHLVVTGGSAVLHVPRNYGLYDEIENTVRVMAAPDAFRDEEESQ